MDRPVNDDELRDLEENADWHMRRGLMQEVYPDIVRAMVEEIRKHRAAKTGAK